MHSLSNRNKAEPRREDLPICPQLLQDNETKVAEPMDQEMEEAQRTVPIPISEANGAHKSTRRRVCKQGPPMCSKFNYCIQNKELPSQENDPDFSIPSILLEDEEPICSDVRPVKMFEVVQPIDQIIEANIAQHKRSKQENKKQEQKAQKQRQAKLAQLQEKAMKKLNACPKKSWKEQKRHRWGHALFSDDAKEEKEQKKKEQKEQQKESEAQKREKKIQLKPVEERIKDYKQRQRKLLQKEESEVECQHRHLNPEKPLSQTKIDIENNAKQILRQKKAMEQKEEEHKRCIEAKIRAIQIHSKESLKKFKKKPVDPTIQFIVDIPENNTRKADRKKSKKVVSPKVDQSDPYARQKNFLRRDTSRSSLSKTQKSKISKVRSENQEPNLIPSEQDQIQQDGNPYCSKFYIWDIPITSEDLKQFDLPAISHQSSRQGKTFRQEVDEYLANKFHGQMQEQNKRMKRKTLDDLIEAKKQQLLDEYNRQQLEGGVRRGMEECFWNEDALFRGHQIANFDRH